MSKTIVLTSYSALSRMDRAWNVCERFFNFLSGLVLFALIGLAVANVIGRKLLNTPIPGYIDWTEQSMIVFAFLGLSLCQREGTHIRMDGVIGRLSGRPLWIVEWLSTLLILCITTVLIYGGWFHMVRSFSWDAPLWSTDSTIDIGLPVWPTKLIIPLALMVLWVRLVLQLLAYGSAVLKNTVAPGAVCLIETTEQQAVREAGLLSTSTRP